MLLMLVTGAEAFGQNYIVVSKKDFMLYVMGGKGDTLCAMPCGIGTNKGNKVRRGDRRTPEGTFTISMIQRASTWTHDFHDGAGRRKGAYGPWFFRLRVPRFYGIGIHGTCFPNSIGTRCSEGCIRLRNDDIVKLRRYVRKGMRCRIERD